jgi:hypothetical protein
VFQISFWHRAPLSEYVVFFAVAILSPKILPKRQKIGVRKKLHFGFRETPTGGFSIGSSCRGTLLSRAFWESWKKKKKRCRLGGFKENSCNGLNSTRCARNVKIFIGPQDFFHMVLSFFMLELSAKFCVIFSSFRDRISEEEIPRNRLETNSERNYMEIESIDLERIKRLPALDRGAAALEYEEEKKVLIEEYMRLQDIVDRYNEEIYEITCRIERLNLVLGAIRE